jgi:hypothetical protein
VEVEMPQDADLVPPSELARYRALFVPASGLPGLALLVDRLAVSMSRARRANRHVGLLIFAEIETPDGGPLDRGDLINAMLWSVRPDDTVAQVADRTIVVVCSDIEEGERLHAIAHRVAERVGVVCRVSERLSGADHDVVSFLTEALREAGVQLV